VDGALSPVFRLEYRITCIRSPIYPLILAAVTGLSGLLFVGFYGMESDFANLTSRSPFTGPVLFLAESLYLMLYVVLFSPWIAGAALSREKKEGTFDLIMSTPLATSSVVGGHIGAAFCRSFLPLLGCIPFLVLAVHAGGVSWVEIPKHLILLGSVTLVVSCLAVLWSLLFRSVWLVGLTTFLCTVFYAMVGGLSIYALCRAIFGSGAALGWLGMTVVSLLLSFMIAGLCGILYRKVALWDY
jgi:hypothetical protein